MCVKYFITLIKPSFSGGVPLSVRIIFSQLSSLSDFWLLVYFSEDGKTNHTVKIVFE